jgi:hypothetical protein
VTAPEGDEKEDLKRECAATVAGAAVPEVLTPQGISAAAIGHWPRGWPRLEADPDLARILDAWPTLPAPIRRAILALVESGQA